VNSSEWQIKDDLFDYTDIGKPTGIDIKEQKMTLPLIYVLNTCNSKEKEADQFDQNHNKDKKRVKEVIAFVKTIMVCFTQKKNGSISARGAFTVE
jgi:octaprenyl-diphosphate synthase